MRWKDGKCASRENLLLYVPNIATIMQSGNLYVYRLNNPVYYVDPSGSLVWPGEIHNAVSNHIQREQLRNYRRWITANKIVHYGGIKYGFANLYDKATGEVWEIKPLSYYDKNTKRIASEAQLQRYIDNIDGAIAGSSLGSGSFYYFSMGKVVPVSQVYKVYFESHNNGMIYYWYDPIFNEEAAAAITLMLAAMAAWVYNGSSVPIPGF